MPVYRGGAAVGFVGERQGDQVAVNLHGGDGEADDDMMLN